MKDYDRLVVAEKLQGVEWRGQEEEKLVDVLLHGVKTGGGKNYRGRISRTSWIILQTVSGKDL